MSSIKSLKVTYNPINEINTFTNGDWISGQVTVEVGKDCQIDSLMIKFRAKADVLWSERYGKSTVVYHAKEKYFSIKHFFIRDKKQKGDDSQSLLRNQHGETYSCVVAPGSHVYPFAFQVPFANVPSSFRGTVGKIVYHLEAKLSRSLRISKKDSADINFVSRADANTIHIAMVPQHESKDKKTGVFSSGSVSMDVNIEKTGFVQGEQMKVLAVVQNKSSREVKLKYCVYFKHSFFASGKRKVHTNNILKEVGEPIPPSTNQTVTRAITIPVDAKPSIFNCNIIKVEYRLKVYLDVKFASDPEVKLPIIILPALQAPAAAAPPGPSDFGLEPYGNPSPPTWGAAAPAPPAWGPAAPAPPAWGTAPMAPPAWGPAAPQPPSAGQPSDAPPPYGKHNMYPALAAGQETKDGKHNMYPALAADRGTKDH